MPKKRSSQSGPNSATAKLISRINKFGQNVINNSFDQAYELIPRNSNHLSFDDDDDDEDEVFVLTLKQKQQLARNEYLESLTKEQLKIEAKRKGQKTSGTKTELVQLLIFILLVFLTFVCFFVRIGTKRP
jgi:hypothetical protein